MRTARAAVFPAPDAPVELREYALPDLADGEALLRVECSEVCGTDVHLHRGKLAGVPYPLIPGHVTAGTLAAVRGELRDVHGVPLREGERVTFLDVHRTCHRCWHCLVAKASTRCPERKVYGITYGAADGLCGGWADVVHLKAGTRVIRLGSLASSAFLHGGCALPTALHGLERAQVAIGDSVLVLGIGPVGLACIALARTAGAATVLAIGGPAARAATARAMGADDVLVLDAAEPPQRVAWVRERTGGRGADVVVEAAGAPDAVVQAMRCARDAGRVVVLGQYTDHGDVAWNPHADLNKKHLDVRGCWGSDYSHFHRAVQVAAHERLGAPWRALPTRTFALADAAAALAAVERGEVIKALVVP
jgi:threonine dehydrogenase-like Zn-dependent dehydrogenase